MGPLIGLVLLFIVLAVLNNDFVDPSNLRNLLRQVSINALIAFGMTFVILTGGIDLSVGSILALTSAVMANAIANGMSPEVSMVLAAVLGIGQRCYYCLWPSGSIYCYTGNYDHLPWYNPCFHRW